MPESGVSRLSPPVGQRDHAHGPLARRSRWSSTAISNACSPGSRTDRGRAPAGPRRPTPVRLPPLPVARVAPPRAERSRSRRGGSVAQGRFFEMHAALFEHQDALGDDHPVTYAADLGPGRGPIPSRPPNARPRGKGPGGHRQRARERGAGDTDLLYPGGPLRRTPRRSQLADRDRGSLSRGRDGGAGATPRAAHDPARRATAVALPTADRLTRQADPLDCAG